MLQSSSLFPNYRSGAFVNRDSGQLIDPRAELPVVLRILGKFAREDEAFASPRGGPSRIACGNAG
jgi:hypothetical protein